MAIASRVVAVILTAFPFAAALLAIFRQELAVLEKLTTYEELRAYTEWSLTSSYWLCFAVVLIVGFGYIALVEGVAFLLRVPFRREKRCDPTTV